MSVPAPLSPKGRGAAINPAGRFERVVPVADFEHLEHDAEFLEQRAHPATEYLVDASRSVVSENDSPDIPFRYSLNPYRGCLHGCSYCYARPYHEYLGLSGGLDFETKIFVKHDAPRLFAQFLSRPAWSTEPITLSGVTDPYQPGERTYRLTRQCLEVALEARQPLDLITKNALVTRDLDLLQDLARRRLVRVALSVTSLDAELARTLEPRTSTPAARLAAISKLRAVRVPVQAMIAPIIPGLNDAEIPALLAAVADAGATAAGFTLLRLPRVVAPVFLTWLEQHRPNLRERIENAVRSTHAGQLNGGEFGKRMRGSGELAEQIGQLFQVLAQKHGLTRRLPPSDCTQFRPPTPPGGQLRLF